MKRLTVLVTAALTLVACAPDSGTVTDKSYRAPYSSWTAGYYSSGSCYSYNKQGGCAIRGPMVHHPGHWTYHPASWQLRLVNGDDSGWRSVNSGVWDTCTVGDHFENESCVQL